MLMGMRSGGQIHFSFITVLSSYIILYISLFPLFTPLACLLIFAEIISAIEFQDVESLDLVVKHIPNAKDPLSEPTSFYMLIETAGSNADHDQEKIASFLEALEENGLTTNGTLADTDAKVRQGNRQGGWQAGKSECFWVDVLFFLCMFAIRLL